MTQEDAKDFELLSEYDLTEKITHIVRHVLTKVGAPVPTAGLKKEL